MCITLLVIIFVLCSCSQMRTLKGHINEKNFVGLAVNGDFLACGSETNEVFAYYKVISSLELMKCIPIGNSVMCGSCRAMVCNFC